MYVYPFLNVCVYSLFFLWTSSAVVWLDPPPPGSALPDLPMWMMSPSGLHVNKPAVILIIGMTLPLRVVFKSDDDDDDDGDGDDDDDGCQSKRPQSKTAPVQNGPTFGQNGPKRKKKIG